MTKKELKQIEDEKKKMNILRYRLVDAYTNFNGDIDAYHRVCRINGDEMTDEIRQKVLDRYPILKEYGYTTSTEREEDETIRCAIYQIVKTENQYKTCRSGCRFENGIGPDTLVYDEIFGCANKLVVMVKYMKLFGYDRLIYTKNNIDQIVDLVDMGCKVVDTNRKNGDGCLVFDVTDANLEMFLCKRCERERKELVNHNAEWGRETSQEDIDKINAKYKALADIVK